MASTSPICKLFNLAVTNSSLKNAKLTIHSISGVDIWPASHVTRLSIQSTSCSVNSEPMDVDFRHLKGSKTPEFRLQRKFSKRADTADLSPTNSTVATSTTTTSTATISTATISTDTTSTATDSGIPKSKGCEDVLVYDPPLNSTGPPLRYVKGVSRVALVAAGWDDAQIAQYQKGNPDVIVE